MTDATNPQDDPGWPRGPAVLKFLIPGAGQRSASKADDGLFQLRRVMIAFSFALLGIGVVVPVANANARGAALPWIPVLVAGALISLVVARATDRPLDCSSVPALAGAYRTRMFLRIAIAESVALLGFVLVFVGAVIWTYYVGAAFAMVRFWSGIAPTRRSLQADQEKLDAEGCGLSLVAALRDSPVAAT